MNKVIPLVLLIVLQTTALAADESYFGFTPFPYDFSPEAIKRTNEIVTQNGTLYGLHFDNGLPWKEVLNDQPFSNKFENEIGPAKNIPGGKKVYLGLAPFAKDRKSLTPQFGESKPPKELQNKSFDDPLVQETYLKFVRRMVSIAKPDFLNIGIEAGELARNNPGAWPQFENFFRYVRDGVKREFPNVEVGISFGLHSLWGNPGVSDRVRNVVEMSDYVGVSFYPYTSAFGEIYGGRPLPSGPDSWRVPLKWLSGYTRKPIAICETGFSSVPVHLPSYNLSLDGGLDVQAQYVTELFQMARRDRYLFVVWFLVVDYDRLYEKMGKSKEIEGNLIWRNIGLFDGNANPKPAWKNWQESLKSANALDPATWFQQLHQTQPFAQTQPQSFNAFPFAGQSVKIGFTQESDLFHGTGRFSLIGKETWASGVMLWKFKYSRDWSYALKQVAPGRLNGISSTRFWIHSGKKAPLFLQLKERSGEAFFIILEPDSKWKEVKIPFTDFQIDPKTQQNGWLEPSEISEILLADPAGTEGARGNRSVQITNWLFE